MSKVNKNLKCSQRQNWIAVSKQWCKLKVVTNKQEDLNLVLSNHGVEEKIYPLNYKEIAKAQNKDQELKIYL
jgi:hypothetical protein